MTSDLRIATDLTTHPKTRLLIRRVGERGFRALMTLWSYAANNRLDGDLSGMDDDAIAAASDWPEDRDSLVWVQALASVGFLDGEPGAYTLHDWVESQPWIAERKARQERARELARMRWDKRTAPPVNAARNAARNAQRNAPNPTQPNPTVDHASTEVDASAVAGETATAATPEKPVKGRARSNAITLDRDAWRIVGITSGHVERWKRAAPLVDIATDIAAAEAWCAANPDKAPRTRIEAFLVKWFNRTQERARKGVPTRTSTRPDPNDPTKDRFGRTYGSVLMARELGINIEGMDDGN